MADVQFNPENKDIDQLQGQGLRAYVLQDYETACRIYSNVSELLVEKHKDDLHDELGDVYLQYGKSLLELSRKEADAINDGVIKNVPEDDDDEDQEEEGGEEEQGDDEEGGEEGEQGDEEEGGKGDEEKDEKMQEQDDKNKGEDKSNGDAANVEAVAGTSSGAAQDSAEVEKAEEADEDASDLQLAWEVLELAKKIFSNRGDAGLKQLAETLVVLGEVALESGNYKPGIDDMVEGLRIQKTLFPEDSRIVAETCFILGGAYSSDGQIDNSIASYEECLKMMEKRLANLKAANSKDNADEIEEIEGLIPDVKEKVADMLNFKEEVAKREAKKIAEAAPSNGTSSASSSKQASDISHLVKRKRKAEEPEGAQPATKRPTPEK